MTNKFLFDTQFEGPKAKPKTPPPPSFLQADLDRVRAEGIAQGRAEGLAEAKASQEAMIVAQLEKLGGEINRLLGERAEAAAESERHALEVARAALSKLFPRLTREQGLREIEAVVEACLARLREEPRLVVRVADGALDRLSGRIDELAERTGFAGKIVVLAEDRLKAGDVIVEWADGGAERNQGKLWQTIEELIVGSLRPHASDRFAENGEAADRNDIDPAAQPSDDAPLASDDDAAAREPSIDGADLAARSN